MSNKNLKDSGLPPSYEESINQTQTAQSYVQLMQNTSQSLEPPRLPIRPSIQEKKIKQGELSRQEELNRQRQIIRQDESNIQRNNGKTYTELINNNSYDNIININNLKFKFPEGFMCKNCKNTGYNIKNGEICYSCWHNFFLKNNNYNPNPLLPFKYPLKFFCSKCYNTGFKRKNGKSCKDCWIAFCPRNVGTPVASTLSFSPFRGLFGTFTGTIIRLPLGLNNIVGYNNLLPPIRALPGDPRLGGILCGGCRGSGTTYFLFEELCPVCNGLGRVLNTLNPKSSSVYQEPIRNQEFYGYNSITGNTGSSGHQRLNQGPNVYQGPNTGHSGYKISVKKR